MRCSWPSSWPHSGWRTGLGELSIWWSIELTSITVTGYCLSVSVIAAERYRWFGRLCHIKGQPTSTGLRSKLVLTQVALLKEVLPLIPPKCSVVLLGDREFRSTSLMGFCQRRGWHFRLRLKCDTWIRANRLWFQLRDLDIQPGQKRFFQTVYITKRRQGPYHLACYWKKGEDEPWFIATDETADGRTLFEYKKRFHTEAMFSDKKKRGFQLEATRIKTKERINRLLLVIVLASLWMSQLGLRCIRSGQRRFFEKSKRRFYSLLQLGIASFFEQLNGDKVPHYALPRIGSRVKLLFCSLRQ